MTDSFQEFKFELDDDLYNRFSDEADEKGVPVDQYISDLIIQYMMEIDSDEDVIC